MKSIDTIVTGDLMWRIARTRPMLLLWRIALVYLAMAVCRLIFWLYNRDLIGAIALDEVWELFKGALLIDTSSIVYTNSLFILLSILPLPMRIWGGGRYQSAMFLVYVMFNGAFIIAANMADAVYFHYALKRCTSDEIFFAENGNTFSLVLKFAVENWYMVLLSIAMIAAMAWGYRRRRESIDLTRGVVRYTLLTVVMLLAAWLSIGGMRGGMNGMTRPITLSNAMLYTSSSAKAYLIMSNPFCVIRSVDAHLEYCRYFDDDERAEALFSPSHYPEDYTSEMFGRYEGYNVVLFILESFSAEHSKYLSPDLYPGDEAGHTPFLDELMQRSLTFTRCYANGLVSVAAPSSIWCSIPSYGKPFILTPYALGECRPMPRLLADKGYDTAFFCGSERGSMGFGAYARQSGIDRLYSMEDFEAVHGNGEFDGSWGIWDEPFLQFMGEQCSRMREPFFSTVFTLTSHHPFVVPKRYRDVLPEGCTRNHKPVEYTDMSIRRFFERFSGEDWFDRTIFVFVADHVSSEKFAERTRQIPGTHHIAGFMYVPDGSLQRRCESVVSQIDFAPTVLGLLGNREPYFGFGRDIHNEPGRRPFVLLRTSFDYTILTDDYIVDFDTRNVTGVYRFDDAQRADNLMPRGGESDVAWAVEQAKASIQQYFEHVGAMNYLPDVRVSSVKPIGEGDIDSASEPQ